MSSKHTPGPWKVADTLGEWDDYMVGDGSGDKIVAARIYTKEDAHLIAAAPDLLAALEVLVENGGIGPRGMFDDASWAIAKAKGEA